uniref:Uncharacterized protein n=1 Tax=Oryza barthii TaxID=65489 RepID=A0A0D3H743_9ORYZ
MLVRLAARRDVCRQSGGVAVGGSRWDARGRRRSRGKSEKVRRTLFPMGWEGESPSVMLRIALEKS